MTEQNKNPHDIKKFKEVLGESYMMIPDSKNRYEQALSDLAAFINSDEVEGLGADEWFLQAKELLKTENISVEKDNADIVEETDVADLPKGEAF